jgi:hypothetical protein
VAVPHPPFVVREKASLTTPLFATKSAEGRAAAAEAELEVVAAPAAAGVTTRPPNPMAAHSPRAAALIRRFRGAAAAFSARV